jgi:hypothetical protein
VRTTVTVVFEVCIDWRHEERRRRPGINSLGRWTKRWLERNGFEVAEPPVARVLRGRRRMQKRLRWTMLVRPVPRG